jgi:enamine deaminase RidA (YjgF/YER057c/UK114 family)
MGEVDLRLAALGIELPAVGAPVANYVPVVVHGGLATVSGQLPRDGERLITGRVGETMSIDDGRLAARACAIAIIAALRQALDGDLDRVERLVQLTGFVNAPAGFSAHPQVVNGASDLMVQVFGEKGRHARAAVGVSSLPLDAAVEVSAVFAVR